MELLKIDLKNEINNIREFKWINVNIFMYIYIYECDNNNKGC